ncbi:hypothetical protein BGZ63DRAFT_336786, partial [Mariannaea sp. PMI_226]
VCFLVYSRRERKLEEMGLRLRNGQEESLDELVRLLTVERAKRDDLHKAVYSVLLSAVTDESRTTQNNIVLWWLAILVRSSVAREEEKEDYISRGEFRVNILPLNIGLRQRVEGLVYYSKAFLLDQAVGERKGEERWVGENMSEVKHMDEKWSNGEHGSYMD